MNELNLEKFRTVFLKSDGWQVSDCYKTYDDKFLRKDAQDAYEGAKWAWQEQQAKIDELQKLRSLDEMAINQLAQANQVWQIKCDELQARIDEALRFYNEAKSPHNIGMIQMAIYLKGNKDEN